MIKLLADRRLMKRQVGRQNGGRIAMIVISEIRVKHLARTGKQIFGGGVKKKFLSNKIMKSKYCAKFHKCIYFSWAGAGGGRWGES